MAANNLANGDAFRFQSTEAAGTIGQLRFGLDIKKPVAKPPFVTNGTGLVTNLNADRVDGKSAEDFAEKSSLDNYVTKGSLLFAAVAADGTIARQPRRAGQQPAQTATDGGDPSFSVPFSGDLSKCVATANPTASAAGGTLIVGAPTSTGAVTVIERDAPGGAPYSFALQVTC